MIDPQLKAFMLLTIVAGALIYFIPSIIAFRRKAKSRWLIFFLSLFFILSGFVLWSIIWLNFFLGISKAIFWFAALVWSIEGKKEETTTNLNTGGENE